MWHLSPLHSISQMHHTRHCASPSLCQSKVQRRGHAQRTWMLDRETFRSTLSLWSLIAVAAAVQIDSLLFGSGIHLKNMHVSFSCFFTLKSYRILLSYKLTHYLFYLEVEFIFKIMHVSFFTLKSYHILLLPNKLTHYFFFEFILKIIHVCFFTLKSYHILLLSNKLTHYFYLEVESCMCAFSW